MPCVDGIHTSQPERKALVFPLEDRPPTNSGHVPPQPGAKAAATRCPQPSPARGARSEADFRTDLWLPVSMLSMVDIVWWEVETAAPEKFMAFHRGLQGWTFVPAFEDSELDASYWIIRVGESGIGGLQRTSEGTVPCCSSQESDNDRPLPSGQRSVFDRSAPNDRHVERSYGAE